MRGRWAYNNPVASVMLDSHAFLQQAEEKFLAGRISESEYFDIRRDLQRIAASSEYHLLQHHMPRRMVIIFMNRKFVLKGVFFHIYTKQ